MWSAVEQLSHSRSVMMKHQVAYITGGSKGIGLGIAKVLLDHGLNVAISGRSGSALESARDTLGADPDRLLTIVSDVRNQQDEMHAVEAILKKWGRLDVLVANAGLGHFAAIEEMTSEQWNQVIDTNLTGVFHSVKAAIPPLKASHGYIITMASLAGTNFFPNGAAYNASKFGLVGFTQAIMLDLRHHGIKVTTIMPGSVTSHFNNHVPDSSDAWKIQPEDLGQMVLDLLQMHPRTLPSKIEVRPSQPPQKG